MLGNKPAAPPHLFVIVRDHFVVQGGEERWRRWLTERARPKINSSPPKNRAQRSSRRAPRSFRGSTRCVRACPTPPEACPDTPRNKGGAKNGRVAPGSCSVGRFSAPETIAKGSPRVHSGPGKLHGPSRHREAQRKGALRATSPQGMDVRGDRAAPRHPAIERLGAREPISQGDSQEVRRKDGRSSGTRAPAPRPHAEDARSEDREGRSARHRPRAEDHGAPKRPHGPRRAKRSQQPSVRQLAPGPVAAAVDSTGAE
jgi:hypothetical protein